MTRFPDLRRPVTRRRSLAFEVLRLWLVAGFTLGVTGAFHPETRAAIEAVARMMMEAER